MIYSKILSGLGGLGERNSSLFKCPVSIKIYEEPVFKPFFKDSAPRRLVRREAKLDIGC